VNFRFAALLALCVLIIGAPAGVAAKNQLDTEASPYLKLHALDAVNWRPWNRDTLEEAKKADKPIFLSIGYLACHWCHVMRKESFADPIVGAVINRDYFPILIDREEMPALDEFFQRAMSAIDQPTGWPLNVFLTPDAKPVWGGAYFPREARGNVPGIIDILSRVKTVFDTNGETAARDAGRLVDFMKKAEDDNGKGQLSYVHVDKAVKFLSAAVDSFDGGFDGAPKFPMITELELLWRAYLRTGRANYRTAVVSALTAMSNGGMYDHIDGGFYRYAVDREWKTPHFEKMLDTNARVLRLLVMVWRETRNGLFQARALETIDFLVREMALRNRGLAAALDADSEAANGEEEEGAFYTYSRKQIRDVLGPADGLFAHYYALGPLENQTLDDDTDVGVLHRTDLDLQQIAKQMNMGLRETAFRIEGIRNELRKLRGDRFRPRRDTKVIAAWNGMAIEAITEAGLAFGQPQLMGLAQQVYANARATLAGPNDRLHHSAVGATKGPWADLPDHASLALAALALYEATGDKLYLDEASNFARQAITLFKDEAAGGYFAVAEDSDAALVGRLKPYLDVPNPSGNAQMLQVLARLYYITGKTLWRDEGERLIKELGGRVMEPNFGRTGLLNAYEDFRDALQIVVIGGRGARDTRRLAWTVMRTSLPTRVFQIIKPGQDLPDTHPAMNKTQFDGKATAYVCKGQICSLPQTDARELRQTLLTMRRGKPTGSKN